MSDIKINITPTEKIIGSIKGQRVYPELEDLTIKPSMQEQYFKSSKYGYENVTVAAIESDSLIVEPAKEQQTHNGLFDRVIVNAIESEELTIDPTEEIQTKTGLFDKVTVGKVDTEEKAATLDFSNTDTIEIIPTEGKFLNKVSINKSEGLLPEYIIKDIEIDGVIGTLPFSGIFSSVEDLPNNERDIGNFAIVDTRGKGYPDRPGTYTDYCILTNGSTTWLMQFNSQEEHKLYIQKAMYTWGKTNYGDRIKTYWYTLDTTNWAWVSNSNGTNKGAKLEDAASKYIVSTFQLIDLEDGTTERPVLQDIVAEPVIYPEIYYNKLGTWQLESINPNDVTI